MMSVSEMLPVFSFHFYERCFLFWSQENRNLGVGFRDPGQDTLHRLAVNGFHISAGFFNQRSDLRQLLIGQMQD